VPPDVVKAPCARYREHGKPWHRSRLQNPGDYDFVRIYGAGYIRRARWRAAMAPYVLDEREAFYRGRELLVPAR
jgi:hypothetical protein